MDDKRKKEDIGWEKGNRRYCRENNDQKNLKGQ